MTAQTKINKSIDKESAQRDRLLSYEWDSLLKG